MEEKRLGILYVYNQLLDQIGFEKKVNKIMGSKTWDGWNYGEMAKALLLFKYISNSIPFSSFIEEYGVKEMLGKTEWEFDESAVYQMFSPYWWKILKGITAPLHNEGEEGWNRKEEFPIRKGLSLWISSNKGYPVEPLTNGNKIGDTYRVIRFSKQNKEMIDDLEKPFIGILPSVENNWETLVLNQTPETLRTNGKYISFFSEEVKGLRSIYGLEKIETKVISSDMDELLIRLKKKAWEMGYDEGLLWLNRELKKSDPILTVLAKKLKIWTTRQNDRVLFQWRLKDERVSYKEKLWILSTNLPAIYTDTWIIKTIALRDKWLKNKWLLKMKSPETETNFIPMLSICWVLEQQLIQRVNVSGIKEDILQKDEIARIKWQGGKVAVSSHVNQWMSRLFPED